MWKAGAIGAAAGLVLALLTSLLLPFCNPCWALLIGFGAGLLAAFWERPAASGDGALKGVQAGALTGAGVLLGQMFGAVLNGLIVGPDRAAQMAQNLGIPFEYEGPAQYWTFLLAGNCCCSLFGVFLAAGLGALGGFLGYQIWKPTPSEPAPFQPEEGPEIPLE